jgi:hypothetical protein
MSRFGPGLADDAKRAAPRVRPHPGGSPRPGRRRREGEARPLRDLEEGARRRRRSCSRRRAHLPQEPAWRRTPRRDAPTRRPTGGRSARRVPSYDRPVSDSPYRVPAPRPPDPYLVAWANLRRRKAFAWAAALLWALAFTITLPAIVARARVVGIAAAVTAVCWVSGIVGNIVLAHFRCPRCGSNFYGARRTRAPWSSACVTCRIEMGTPKYSRAGDAP